MTIAPRATLSPKDLSSVNIPFTALGDLGSGDDTSESCSHQPRGSGRRPLSAPAQTTPAARIRSGPRSPSPLNKSPGGEQQPCWLAPCRQPRLLTLLSCSLPTLMGRMAPGELSRFQSPSSHLLAPSSQAPLLLPPALPTSAF